MRRLVKHNLKPDLARVYAMEHLRDGNRLSAELLLYVDFAAGTFFTLLPEEARIERIYDFTGGGILPALPPRECHVLGGTYMGEIIPTMQGELALFLLQRLKRNIHLSFVFEEILKEPDSKFLAPFYEENLATVCDREVFYILNNSNCNKASIENCLRESRTVWHFVGAVSHARFESPLPREIPGQSLEQIAQMTQLLILGAYDGEGYIFWERNGGCDEYMSPPGP